MAGVTVYASLPLAVTIYAPSHGLIDLAAKSVHTADISVTDRAIDLCPDVWLVREKDVGLSLEPVDADPGGLLTSLRDRGQFFDFRALGHHRIVTDHAGADVRRCAVRPVCRVLVAGIAIELRAVFFRNVLPVVELNGLARRFRTAHYAQQGESYDEDQRGRK